MDVRMGVLSHTILQYRSKERITDKKMKNIAMDDADLEDLEWFYKYFYCLIRLSSYHLYI